MIRPVQPRVEVTMDTKNTNASKVKDPADDAVATIAALQAAGPGALGKAYVAMLEGAGDFGNEVIQFVAERIAEDVKTQHEIMECKNSGRSGAYPAALPANGVRPIHGRDRKARKVEHRLAAQRHAQDQQLTPHRSGNENGAEFRRLSSDGRCGFSCPRSGSDRNPYGRSSSGSISRRRQPRRPSRRDTSG